MLRTLRQRWRETRLTPQVHREVHRLAACIQESLSMGAVEGAIDQAEQMHVLSQNHLWLHVYGHWTFTKVYLAVGQRRPAMRHTYLMCMAPYGTVSRRLRRPSSVRAG